MGSSFRIRDLSSTNIVQLFETTSEHTSEIALSQRPFLTGENYNNNLPLQGNIIDNIYTALAAAGAVGAIKPGRTVTFNNNTSSTNIDLYLTLGGTNPQPLTKITTINVGNMFVWPISDTKYGLCGNFTTMPAGVTPPKSNAGPTLFEFGFNQVWSGDVPEIRDTFDISTVPPGIGNKANNGPRSLAVQVSREAGFSIQQSFSYNVGIQIVPPAGVLPTQTVICNVTNGDCPGSIGFPKDTAFPKQQSGGALGDYIINFIDPVANLPS